MPRVSAAKFGEQSQDFKVQPNASDHQSEAAVPFCVLRGPGTGSALDKIEIQHQVEWLGHDRDRFQRGGGDRRCTARPPLTVSPSGRWLGPIL